MRILQSKGRSFTKAVADGNSLARGLDPTDKQSAARWLNEGELRIAPAKMPAFLKDDPDLVIRQVVSVLDKVIRKPKSLRDLPLDTYVDRTLLAEELWTRIGRLIAQSHDGEMSQAELDGYKSSWSWKVHPYAKIPADPHNPRGDKNAAFIIKHSDKLRSPFDSKGRWHDALWRKTADEKPDYASTADAIIDHLFSREAFINPRSDRKQAKDRVGLAQRRGASIQSSAPKLELPAGPGAQAKLGKASFDDPIAGLFFHQDVAATIHAFVVERCRADGQRKANTAPSVRASDFGRMLSEHFGNVPNHRDFDGDTKKAIVAFYDQVKRHYAALYKSERFRRAVAKAEIAKLEALLPRDKSHLLASMTGKERKCGDQQSDTLRQAARARLRCPCVGRHKARVRNSLSLSRNERWSVGDQAQRDIHARLEDVGRLFAAHARWLAQTGLANDHEARQRRKEADRAVRNAA